jgi:hypothetical protein
MQTINRHKPFQIWNLKLGPSSQVQMDFETRHPKIRESQLRGLQLLGQSAKSKLTRAGSSHET